MAEQGNSTALAVVDGQYKIKVNEFDAAGGKQELSITLPDNSTFAKWSLLQRAIMLKKGAWAKSPLHEIAFAIVYADSNGLDILRGDVFSTGEGRIGISNKAKIKLAQASGNIVGIEVEMRDTKEPLTITGCVQKTDLECTVTIHVKGWAKPIVRKSRLSRWFNGKNPNWAGRPEHMLELNTVAHACEYVPGAVLATEDDEAPPLDTMASDVAQLKSRVAPIIEAEVISTNTNSKENL